MNKEMPDKEKAEKAAAKAEEACANCNKEINDDELGEVAGGRIPPRPV